MRVEDEDALRADRPPVGHVVLREAPRLLGVAHLGGRPAAAPLLAHEAELDAARPQQLRDGPRLRRAVERRLAVAEEDRLAADRQVELGGPVGDALLRDAVEHGLVLQLVRGQVPALPARLVDAAVDRQRAHGLDQVDRAGAEAVEVAGEDGVRAAQLAGAALGAVDVVLGDVLDAEQAPVHRHDVGVEGGRAVRLVVGHLHHRADLAAELVTRAEAVVRRVPPLVEQPAGPVGRTVVVKGHARSPIGSLAAGAASLPTARGRCQRAGTTAPRAGTLYDRRPWIAARRPRRGRSRS